MRILKEWVIVLKEYERNALFRFLGVYLCSSILILGVIAFLVFSVQKTQIYENIHNQMMLKGSQIAQMIISRQMNGESGLDEKFLQNLQEEHWQFSLFDLQKKRLYGELHFIKMEQKFFVKNGVAYYLDMGAFGHLGVEWILISKDFSYEIYSLLYSIGIIALACLIVLICCGFILGKMFLKPIRDGITYLDHFIKDVTHELNTPISALIMSVNSLKTGVSENKISRIQKACRRIHFLYSNLTFLFLGEVREVRENIDFVELLKARLEMFEEHCKEKNISLEVESVQKLMINADCEALTRLIDNLLSNAIKYNFPNGRILISLTPKSLKIKNTGNPIPQHLIPSLKQRYVRNSSKGYGIGLDIVSKVAHSYDWEICIYTQNHLNVFEIVF